MTSFPTTPIRADPSGVPRPAAGTSAVGASGCGLVAWGMWVPSRPDELISNDETAQLLHIRPQSLAVWRTEGRGPRYLKIGRKVFYRRADICGWLAAQLSDDGEVA